MQIDGDIGVEYRLVPNFPMYCIGDDGSVWSQWGRHGPGWRRMATPPDKDGYPKILLTQGIRFGGLKRHTRVHILVLELFVGRCPEGMESCHKDGNHKNSRLDNLRYGTHQSNIDDRTRHGTTARGSRHAHTKLNDEIVHQVIAMLREGKMKYWQIGSQFGVSVTPIMDIAKNKTWQHIPRELLTRKANRQRAAVKMACQSQPSSC